LQVLLCKETASAIWKVQLAEDRHKDSIQQQEADRQLQREIAIQKAECDKRQHQLELERLRVTAEKEKQQQEFMQNLLNNLLKKP
jgi:hypothetical protein